MAINSASSTNLPPEARSAAATAQWTDLLHQAACDMRVAMPGIIVKFDAVKQTVMVRLTVMEHMQDPTGQVDEAIWPLLDVPIVLPRGGGFSLTLPLKVGDECLVVFADLCIDTWWANGGWQNVQFELRRHDLSDAFCIPGPWSQQRLLPSYSTTSAQLRSDDGSIVIDMAETSVTVTAPAVQVNSTGTVGVNAATAQVTATSTIGLIAPDVAAYNTGGTPLALVNSQWLDWYTLNIQPFLVSLGYTGPIMPSACKTDILKGA